MAKNSTFSSGIKRYDLNIHEQHGKFEIEMIEDSLGNWVEFDELQDAFDTIHNLEEKIETLQKYIKTLGMLSD